jgi:cyanate permease
VHVSSQHLLTMAHPDRMSSVIGGYMVFYSLGSALGAAATTALFDAAGWAGSSVLGAGFAMCALAVWVVDRLIPPAPRVGSSSQMFDNSKKSQSSPAFHAQALILRDQSRDPAGP